MAEPLVSVLMPVHNETGYLREAIDSILRQTLRDFEFLIVNDASDPASRNAINAMAQGCSDERIRLVDNGRNLGLIASLNRGMGVARGHYVARMDADDVSHPARLERQMTLMDSTGADVCGCHFLFINQSGKVIDTRVVPLSEPSYTMYLAMNTPFAHSSVMLRTGFFRQHKLEYGGIQYAEDYDLWARAWESGAKFAAVDEFVFSYRDHGVSAQKRLRVEYRAATKSVRRRFVRRNSEACLKAVRELAGRYSELTATEKLFLVWTSYAVSLERRNSIVFDVVRRSDRRSLVLAMLSLLMGL